MQGQQAAGIVVTKETVIHERRSTSRLLGQAQVAATGVAATPKAAIGLGITATKAKGRTASSGGGAVSGMRKVSSERGKVAFPSVSGELRTSAERKMSGERRSSGERRTSSEGAVSGSKEDDSPDFRFAKRTPKSSMGLKGLGKSELVSRSPFKRVPSGSLSPSTRVNESPCGPSPKTIPVDGDDVFSSPSPRRTSGGKRHVSPGNARPSARTSDSATSSPPQSLAQPTFTTGPSPLSQSQPSLAPQEEPTPTPTPAKSSMTPSRRLRGPREFSDPIESTTKAKTVTFQSVPDVKEFERMSTEGSADGSFEEEQEWFDDADGREADTSLDDMLDKSSLDQMAKLRVTNPDDEIDESTTADFVNTLIEEGLFSPPPMATPAFGAPLAFETMENTPAPFLSTPSMGSSVHVTSLLGSVEPMGDVDSAGIPYGRTHHTERAILAHSLLPISQMSRIEQSAIPVSGDHLMLLNANAAQLSLPQSTVMPTGMSHQDGRLPDPFITIQTATNIISPQRSRSENGIPLGRTSQAERVQAARMLATQSLGIGMPRSPAMSKDLTKAQATPVEESEMIFDASFEMSHEGEIKATPAPVLERQDSGRRLPKPPRPQALDLPSPVSIPVKEIEPPVEKRVSPPSVSMIQS